MTEPPPGYRYERGYLWPADDEKCARYVFESTKDLERTYPHCRAFQVVVQAGGNCGVWPRALGQHFDRVYTFEPCPVNFRCLAANAAAENIYKFNAALGRRPGLVSLVRDPRNIGAHYVDGGTGEIPTMRVDDLALDACDLIFLDIEGLEFHAICGAWKTISRHRPVIVVEDRGFSERYGVARGHIEQVLSPMYRVIDRPHHDVVLVPK